MTLLTLLILITSIILCFMNHPLTMGFILLFQTMLIALLTGLMTLNFWPSYIIFIIMIGGLLILFIYMTNVASNEKFKFSMKLMMMIIISSFVSTGLFLFLDKFMMSLKIKIIETFSVQENINSQFFLNKFINYPYNLIYLTMVIYLLITLIAVVKITSKNKSTLRKNF
uniref:NADH-ubiquinone oxidoreductase chain 6 n=1 Tax=Cryptocephalus mystacatus TaxID=1425555 RepID=A0A3G1GS25_9CUCU|nr:NADH dehydrogenase subunit 6 [Cryptocephalus mystacatus]